MRRRPQPRPRRGLLRAIGAAIILIILLVAAVLITSSLTAPAAHAPAPTPPATPGPVTPAPTPRSTAHTKARPTARPHASRTHTGLGARNRPGQMYEQDGRELFGKVAGKRAFQEFSAAPSPDGRRLAFFGITGSAYARAPLFVSARGRGKRLRVGTGDPLIRPVWSPDGTRLLFVAARPAPALPGTRWSLVEAYLSTRRQKVLASASALGLTPLGWLGGRPAYLLANSTDTSLYSVSGRGPRDVEIVITQAIVNALLSPDGAYLAFDTPANCGYCTVTVFDLRSADHDYGPGGSSDERDLAWTNADELETRMGNRLALFAPESQATHYARIPAGLPNAWLHPMRATAAGRSLTLIDTVSGRSFRAPLE